MDRRFVLAIVLMMVVLMVPPIFLKNQRRPPVRPQPVASPVPSVVPTVEAPPGTLPTKLTPEAPTTAVEDSVVVTSPLYRYTFSTRGGRLIGAELSTYRSMRPDERGQAAQILAPESDFLALALLIGRDTVPLRNVAFTPSTRALTVDQAGRLELSAALDSTVGVDLVYSFVPSDYRIEVSGRVRGLGPTGATLLVGLGPGLRNTESDSVEHSREIGIVTKDTRSQLTRFGQLKPGIQKVLPGPFEWVGVKSKYFVAAVLAPDSGRTNVGRIGGVQAAATDAIRKSPERADIWASLSIGGDGALGFGLYVGPMEYPRLRAVGHDFDDINPYGWAWLRPVIRPVAVGARWLLVWLHESLGLAYGLGLVVFGILIRIVLWPLNQKAMRASMQMQAIQPIVKELQEKYKSEPQRLQQEMFKVYKDNKVNPFSGCWPILLPWPVLIALFFVFQNSIELRGQSFLWVPDLSRADPTFIIPVVMAASMFGVTKIGQLGLPVNPQMKMMLYFMPVMMLVLFLNFAAGLNLYYAVQNLASIPQQWMIAKDRMKNAPRAAPAPVPVPVKKPPTR
jgi:YidC/Oxa1 family membrane protein insertase